MKRTDLFAALAIFLVAALSAGAKSVSDAEKTGKEFEDGKKAAVAQNADEKPKHDNVVVSVLDDAVAVGAAANKAWAVDEFEKELRKKLSSEEKEGTVAKTSATAGQEKPSEDVAKKGPKEAVEAKETPEIFKEEGDEGGKKSEEKISSDKSISVFESVSDEQGINATSVAAANATNDPFEWMVDEVLVTDAKANGSNLNNLFESVTANNATANGSAPVDDGHVNKTVLLVPVLMANGSASVDDGHVNKTALPVPVLTSNPKIHQSIPTVIVATGSGSAPKTEKTNSGFFSGIGRFFHSVGSGIKNAASFVWETISYPFKK